VPRQAANRAPAGNLSWRCGFWVVGVSLMVSKKSSTKRKGAAGAKTGQQGAFPKSRRLTLIIAACLIPALLVGLSLYVKNLTTTAWNAIVKYQSPYFFPPTTVPASGRPATGGVLLIIVDGLRVDTSRTLDTWSAVRNGGLGAPAADLTAVAGQPSLSDPAAAVIPSGASQEIHGVTTNWYEGRLNVDNLFTAALRSGKTTSVIGGKGWVDLYGDSVGRMYEFDDAGGDYDELVLEQTLAVLAAGKDGTAPLPDLIVVHFGGVDNSSHEFGAVSDENVAMAQKLDGYVGRILAAYDLAGRTAILTADHGHIAGGGHGGWEPEVINVPLVFVGKAVTAGQMPAAQQVDIAPTISALLGMSHPSETIGTILDNVVALPPQDLAAAFVDLGRVRFAFSQAYSAVVAKDLPANDALATANQNVLDGNGLIDQAWVNLTAGDPPRAIETAKAGLYLMDEARDKVDALRLSADRRSRLAPCLLLVLLPFAGIFYLARNRWSGFALIAAGGYFALHSLLFYLVRGFRLSLSIFNKESMVEAFFNSRMIDAALVLLAAALILGVVVGFRKRYEGPELAEAAATFSYFVAYGLGLQIVLFYYLFGVNFAWSLPNLVWGFKFYADCLQMVPTGLASVAVVPLALLGAKVAALITTGRTVTRAPGAK
jgi:hypothetical protein